jgi:hypothetical protein
MAIWRQVLPNDGNHPFTDLSSESNTGKANNMSRASANSLEKKLTLCI